MFQYWLHSRPNKLFLDIFLQFWFGQGAFFVIIALCQQSLRTIDLHTSISSQFTKASTKQRVPVAGGYKWVILQTTLSTPLGLCRAVI